ncbi:MAG TPA: DUF2442 domain-containing protein [Gemmatimonadaceae bacterium]|nr:DUF2442 domain-containing protein [Gemmatimonadaceae bacterium]
MADRTRATDRPRRHAAAGAGGHDRRPASLVGDEAILAQLPAARARGRAAAREEPRATSARYDRSRKAVLVELTNGAFFGFPAALGQGLQDATERELASIEVSPSGEALRWPLLDVDLRVPALLQGVFGTRAWMRMLAQAGGRATSDAKARAARANGAKGGRPRKSAAKPER